jgi:hypothetical protein
MNSSQMFQVLYLRRRFLTALASSGSFRIARPSPNFESAAYAFGVTFKSIMPEPRSSPLQRMDSAAFERVIRVHYGVGALPRSCSAADPHPAIWTCALRAPQTVFWQIESVSLPNPEARPATGLSRTCQIFSPPRAITVTRRTTSILVVMYPGE